MENITKKQPSDLLLNLEPVRGYEGIKQAELDIDGTKVKVAVVYGLANARIMIDKIKNGEKYDFVEIMTCPGGCIGGGGQPKSTVAAQNSAKLKRIEAIYKEDTGSAKRCSHDNTEIQSVYKEFFGKPLSEKAEKYLHTTFVNRHDRLFS